MASEFQRQYMIWTREKFQKILDSKSQSTEGVNLRESPAHLLKLVQPWSMWEAVHEVELAGRHLPITHTSDERSSRSRSSPTTLQALFDADESGTIPKVLFLQGAAGIGKTTVCQKLMQDWASGTLYQDKFDFVLYLSCRVISNLPGMLDLVGLLSGGGGCDLPCSEELLTLLRDSTSHKRLLFIIDGFDELSWTLEEDLEIVPRNIFEETQKEQLLLSLLRKQILEESSVVVTTRPSEMRKLSLLVDDAQYVEVCGLKEGEIEEYFQKVFKTKEDAEKALSIIKANDLLLGLCTIPVLCRIMCAVLRPRIHLHSDFSRFTTATSLYLLYLQDLVKPCLDKQAVSTCLEKLCALANEGILKHRLLFTEEDLERRELSLTEVESVFQKGLLFDLDGDTKTFYCFSHLTLQELLAALHYLLEDGSSEEDWTSEATIPELLQGLFFSAVYNCHIHLTFVVRFLFGLLNKETTEALSARTGCLLSLRSKWALGEWLTEDTTSVYFTAGISCLYETQDEDFTRRTMSRSSSLHIIHETHGLLGMSRNALRQLCYCLRLCDNLQSLSLASIKMDPESLEALSPFLLKCQLLSLHFCAVSPDCCVILGTLLTKNRSLTKLDLMENPIEDGGVEALCQGLRDPACGLQELGLYRCELTPRCSEALSSVFSTNRSLIKLNLDVNDIESSGATRLCEGLRHPGCTLQDLSLEDCDLKTPCGEALGSVLLSSRCLTRLNLAFNPLEDIGVKSLCEALQDPGCVMQELSLSGCGLTASCCEDFRSVLLRNRSLTHLDLSSNDLTNPGVRVICEGLINPGPDEREPRTELETTLLAPVNTWEPEASGWMETLKENGCRLFVALPLSIKFTRVR